MAAKKELTKEERVMKEYRRLKKEFKDLPKPILNILEGTISRAADLRVRLEDIAKDLDENGYDEMFSQSENQEPYERERPGARRLIALDKNYQSTMKLLGDYKQKQLAEQPKEEDDGFNTFLNER